MLRQQHLQSGPISNWEPHTISGTTMCRFAMASRITSTTARTRPTFTGRRQLRIYRPHERVRARQHWQALRRLRQWHTRCQQRQLRPTQTLTNYEGGFKFQATIAYADINVYTEQFTGLPYQDTQCRGESARGHFHLRFRRQGRRFHRYRDADPEPLIRLVADYMDGHYDYIGCAPYFDIFGITAVRQFQRCATAASAEVAGPGDPELHAAVERRRSDRIYHLRVRRPALRGPDGIAAAGHVLHAVPASSRTSAATGSSAFRERT